MAPLGNNNATSTFTSRVGALGHTLLWVKATKETETIRANGKDRNRTLYVIHAACSGCDFTREQRGKTDYAATRSSIKQAWRKAHAHLVPADTPFDPPSTPDIGVSSRAYEQAKRDAESA